MKRKKKNASLADVRGLIFKTQFWLVVFVATLMGAAASVVNIRSENARRREDLQNVAATLARSGLFAEDGSFVAKPELLDSIKRTLSKVDVISVVGADSTRAYHSNRDLIGTVYDGAVPAFRGNEVQFSSNETGPSGRQIRAYAAIYDKNGVYRGFVMTVALAAAVRQETVRTILTYVAVALVVAALELALSAALSKKIREALNGCEPDVFSAMYRVRDNILESLDEGVVAVDASGQVQFANGAATRILAANSISLDDAALGKGENVGDVALNKSLSKNILMDRKPVCEAGEIVGAVAVLRDRAEYVKLMENLSGARYLVDSMRANNHDFTNKLHVVLGLIQMGMNDEAAAYIENVAFVQRETISKIMNAIDDPAISALLIGKNARAAELNVKFALRDGTSYRRDDVSITSATLVTIVGNLIDNSLDAMNFADWSNVAARELKLGLYSKPGSALITVDDDGCGVCEENLAKIFENGFSTKGEGRGTGLYWVKNLVERNGGKITVESAPGKGASFVVRFGDDTI